MVDNATSYYDVVHPIFGTEKNIKEILIKNNHEASPKIGKDGNITICILEDKDRPLIPKGKVGFNPPAVAGVPITFCDGDDVKTKDGRKGIVLGSHYLEHLVLYDNQNQPRHGYFVVKVDIDGKIEYHIRKKSFRIKN